MVDEQLRLTSSESKQLNMGEFNKKYETQRIKWEKNRNQLPPPVDLLDEGIDEKSFKPTINEKSRKLAKDIEKIENRVKKLNEGRQQKLQYLEKLQNNYSFKPNINQKSA